MIKKELPKAIDFSPGAAKGEFDLREALELVGINELRSAELRDRFFERWFTEHAEGYDLEERRKNQKQLAGHVISGMKNYGLLSASGSGISQTRRLTSLGLDLLKTASDEEMYDKFASYIYFKLYGADVITAVRNVSRRTEKPTSQDIADELRRKGFDLPNATTNHTRVIQWLSKASIFEGFKLDEEKLDKVIGPIAHVIDQWKKLPESYQVFLEVVQKMCALQANTRKVSQVIERTQSESGSKIFLRDDKVNVMLRTLVEGGWVRNDRRTVGHGGNSGSVGSTKKLLDFDMSYVTNVARDSLPREIDAMSALPLQTLLDYFESPVPDTKLSAVLGFSVRLLQDLELRNIRIGITEARPDFFKGVVTASGLGGLHYSRWMLINRIQDLVSDEEVAADVEEALSARAHMVLLLTTGRFSASVYNKVREENSTSLQQVALFSSDQLTKYVEGEQRYIQNYFAKFAAKQNI